jgi:hypothetical protein
MRNLNAIIYGQELYFPEERIRIEHVDCSMTSSIKPRSNSKTIETIIQIIIGAREGLSMLKDYSFHNI